jgi:universal stress protein A
VKTILVPVDFSEISAKTAETAFALVQDIHVKLVFLHVLNSPPAHGGVDPAVKLDALVRAAREQGIVATIRLAYGTPVAQILSLAEELRADLIVMGSHDRLSTHGSSVGSTTRGVLAAAPCPLVLVPSEKAKAESLRRRDQLAANTAI